MAKSAPLQTSFNTGEMTPLMKGRVDFDKYKTALGTCLNHIPLVQGPATRRPGTIYVGNVKDSTAQTRLVRFEFSTTQAYVLEFGNFYVRIYRNHGRVESPPGTPVEIVTPYTTGALSALFFTQSADTLYVAHPSWPPQKITRTSDTSWSITQIDFHDGPYLDTNTEAGTTLTLSATSGAITVTASATTGINGGAGFANTDVGRLIRWQDPASHWTWMKITAWTSTTVVSAQMAGPNASATTATANWRLGVWSGTTGYPACNTFFQDRLGWAGSTSKPQSIYFSTTGAYETHSPTGFDASATVTASNALAFTLNSSDVQIIRWMSGDANGLLVGTVSGEWSVSPSTQNEALTPTNINAKQMTGYGNAQVPPQRIGYTTLTLQRSLRKIRELTFTFYENRYKAPDMTVLAQHITAGGIVEMAYQQEPNSILWARRSDGVLLGFTYERDQNVVGWHRHVLGGTSDANGTAAQVESVACIPAPDGTRDEVWLIVKRWVNGAAVRHIEYMTKIWEHGDSQATCCYVDAGLQYAGPPATTITGLTHLIGETVKVLADGAVHPDCVVDGSGHITLNAAASYVTAGYGYNSDGQTLRNDSGAADGTAQGKTQRKHRVTFRLLDSEGISVGPDFDNLTRRINRSTADNLGAAVPLFTGDDSDTWEGDYSTEDLIAWRFDQPLPGTVLAICPQQMTFDR